ncbi:MAG: hypothetical protein SH859_12415 [Hyphomicrobium aestuarii]|nr:hypothetical protein [Hyphomicrobium aestuarii]
MENLTSATTTLSEVAYCLLRSKGDALTSIEVHKSAFNSSDRRQRSQMILRAAVSAGTTSDPSWAGSLADYRIAVSAFSDSMRSVSLLDAMMPFAARVPLRTRIVIATAAAVGASVAGAELKPATRLNLSAGDLLERKSSTLIVISEELIHALTAGDAVDLINRELRGATARAATQELLGVIGTGSPSHTSSNVPLDDLRAMLAIAAISGSPASRYFLVVSAAIAAQLATWPDSTTGGPAFPQMTPSGGTIQGISVIATDAPIASATAFLVDAAQVALAAESFVISTAAHASLQMDDAPSAGATNLISLWQSNSVAILAERFFGVLRMRDEGVVRLLSPDYAP